MKVVYLQKRDWGATMTCWVACLMWLDWNAKEEGMAGYYHWPRELCIWPMIDDAQFAKEPNMFNWWWIQPNIDLLGPGIPSRDATWTWEEPHTMPPGVPGIHGMGQKTYEWYSRLKVRPEIVARADALAVKYGLDLNNTIAVSNRGCEALLDDERDHASETIENYFPHLDKILAEEPNLKILATAEEHGVAERVLSRYPDRTVIPTEFWRVPAGYGATPGNPQHSGWNNPVSGYERGVMTCMMISLFSRCKYYIRNKSNLGQISGWIKGGKGVIRIGSRASPEFWG